MSFEIEGTLFKKYPTESKTASFQTREFVLQIASGGQYSEHPKFQLVQDRVSLLDQFEEGDRVKVFFDLRGREWQGKYFTNLNCWRMERADAASGIGAEASGPSTASVSGAGLSRKPSSDLDFPDPSSEPQQQPAAQSFDDLPF